VTYVWFDALVNYFSIPAALGDPAALAPLGSPAPASSSLSVWPADIHLIGKDILKFHAVYWPIMLHALGAPLPKTILVHGWWQKDGAKLSKSTGNVVDPLAIIGEWGLDAFRYYVVRELGIGPDGNWTDDGFRVRYNSELANGLGNLLNRAVNMLNKYRAGVVPSPSSTLAVEATAAVEKTRACYLANDPQGALIAAWELVNRANLFVEETKPFHLAKDPAQSELLDSVLYNLVESCRILAVLVQPVMPAIADKIFAQLQVGGAASDWKQSAWGGLAQGHQVGAPIPLFPRKDLAPK
jgi:methionyl-tRNA synthetase